MDAVLSFIQAVCARIQVVSDLLWDFPTNFEWYARIPVIGNFSLAIILLIGSGIFFTVKLGFIQIRKFRYSISVLMREKAGRTGLSPLASFLLSTAMRVGPGNILGVTGAVSVGGPGALLWMWVSAFFGMATAFVESTLAQIFKEKKGDEYIGGMSYYGRRLLRDSALAGTLLSVLYLIYAFLCFPAQGFNTIFSMGQIAGIISGRELPTTHAVYWAGFAAVIAVTVVVSWGGTRRISRVTDVMVPVMAVVYVLTSLILILINFSRIPWFFSAVFTGAFRPEAVFGGAFGTVLMQGVRRGLMSNEAGQGTITMPAATADAAHPCDQGCVQALGVFLDTIVIATMTAFIVIMGRAWLTDGAEAWFEAGKLQKYLISVEELTPGAAAGAAVTLIVTACFGLFAFTCLLGFMSFSEISANRISRNPAFINTVRLIDVGVIVFGMLTSIVGMDLAALWNLSDLANILMTYCNIPLLYIGFRYVKRAQEHFDKGGSSFGSDTAGIDLPVWDEKAGEEKR